jgi:hypothetical protein
MLPLLRLLKQSPQPKPINIESEIASKLPIIIQELGIITSSYKFGFKTVRYYTYKSSPISPELLITQTIQNNYCIYTICLDNIKIFTAHDASHFTLKLPVTTKQIILDIINNIYESVLQLQNNKREEIVSQEAATINKVTELCNMLKNEVKGNCIPILTPHAFQRRK